MKRNPGDLFRKFQAKMQKASMPVKTSGSFQGKSNTLGHGGRAAQLKARGVPGGVIGNLARAAQAAPGQKNFHGGKKKKASIGAKVLPTPSIIKSFTASVRNPNSPTNYGPAMNRAMTSTQTYGVPGAKKAAIKKKGGTVIAPKNFGSKAQNSFANQFGIVPQSSTRTRTKRKGAGLKKEMAVAFKKRKSAKKKAMDCA